jgi:acyl-CoA dehydrogenase
VAAGIGAHVSIATPPIWRFGTEEQKRRFLTPAIRADRRPRYHGARGGLGRGRHPHLRSQGGRRLSRQRLEGVHHDGVRADVVVTAVKTTGEGGHHGLSFLVLEKGMPGFTVSRKLEKLGWHASDTAELAFQDVFVPDENLLGEENKGFYLIMAGLQWERLAMALGAVGSMGAVVEEAVERLPTGERFRHAVAELAVRHEASRSLTYHALRLFAGGSDALREVTAAKLLSQRAAFEVAETAFRMLDGDLEMAARCATPASARSAAAPTR